MLKKFKDLQVGDRLYIPNQKGKFFKVQIVFKNATETLYGMVDFLDCYTEYLVPYPSLNATPNQLFSVYSHATTNMDKG